jgi:polygalacturonase
MKKIIAIGLISLIILSSAIVYILVNKNQDENIENEFEPTYIMDETNDFVKDIPKENYLHQVVPAEGEIIFNIIDYGASTTNDFTSNRDAIQDAIDAASVVGGVVLVTGGNYKTTSIELKSNITLRIDANASIINPTFEENKALDQADRISSYGFVFSNNADNITIEGPGKICGNGATYCYQAEDDSKFLPMDVFNLKTYIIEHRKRIMMGKEDEESRSYILGMVNCSDVNIRNIEIYEAPAWTCRLEGMGNLLIEDVVINNNVNVANSDGFDIEGGRNITIRHCFIATGDDAICIKTDNINIPPLEGILIEDCEVMSLANCFKIGTGTWTDVSDVTVRNCFFFMAGIAGGYAGIAIESVDGGNIHNININNITMEGVASPLLIWLGYRNPGSKLEDITITNITATNCDIASAITGYEKNSEITYIKNVILRNFNITYREANESLDIYDNEAGAYEGDMNMGGYPEITRVSHRYILNHTMSDYWDLPVYGLFARHVDGLTVENFLVNARASNTRPMNNIQNAEDRVDVKNVTWS